MACLAGIHTRYVGQAAMAARVCQDRRSPCKPSPRRAGEVPARRLGPRDTLIITNVVPLASVATARCHVWLSCVLPRAREEFVGGLGELDRARCGRRHHPVAPGSPPARAIPIVVVRPASFGHRSCRSRPSAWEEGCPRSPSCWRVGSTIVGVACPGQR